MYFCMQFVVLVVVVMRLVAHPSCCECLPQECQAWCTQCCAYKPVWM